MYYPKLVLQYAKQIYLKLDLDLCFVHRHHQIATLVLHGRSSQYPKNCFGYWEDLLYTTIVLGKGKVEAEKLLS